MLKAPSFDMVYSWRLLQEQKLADDLKIRREFLSGFLEAMKEMGELTVIDVGVAKVYMPMIPAKRGGNR